MPNKKTGNPTLNERRKEQERKEDYSDLKKYRDNLISILSKLSQENYSHTKKQYLAKDLDTLKNHPFINKIFEGDEDKALAADLLKIDKLLNAIAELYLRRHLDKTDINPRKYNFK